MSNYRNRNNARSYRGVSEHPSNRYGLEDSYRNEDYFDNSAHRSRGFQNADYDDRNFWASGSGNSQAYDSNDGYFGNGSFEPRGRDWDRYGRENQPYSSRREQANGFMQGRGDKTGYRGRSSDDYRNNDDRDSYYYNPADYDRGGYRRNEHADNYNDFAGGGYNENRRYGSGRQPQYNYYESYPSYGQGAPYNDHERGYIDKQEARGVRGIDNEDTYGRGRRDDTGYNRRFSENEYGRRHRPSIRNKRY